MRRNQEPSNKGVWAYGFTLIEMMVVVGIISIMLAVAYPAYTEYVQRAHQEDARQVLLDWASSLENYRGKNFSYTGAGSMTSSLAPQTVGHKHYGFKISVPSAQKYTISASPTSSTMSGTETFVLDSQGRTCGAVGGCTPSATSSW